MLPDLSRLAVRTGGMRYVNDPELNDPLQEVEADVLQQRPTRVVVKLYGPYRSQRKDTIRDPRRGQEIQLKDMDWNSETAENIMHSNAFSVRFRAETTATGAADERLPPNVQRIVNANVAHLVESMPSLVQSAYEKTAKLISPPGNSDETSTYWNEDFFAEKPRRTEASGGIDFLMSNAAFDPFQGINVEFDGDFMVELGREIDTYLQDKGDLVSIGSVEFAFRERSLLVSRPGAMVHKSLLSRYTSPTLSYENLKSALDEKEWVRRQVDGVEIMAVGHDGGDVESPVYVFAHRMLSFEMGLNPIAMLSRVSKEVHDIVKKKVKPMSRRQNSDSQMHV